MPHVKNPLSVVAIFAGIAEVSGAVVLPLIEAQTQLTFIWFLMGFPVLLVGLFFATLNWNHTVFYAPSDFKDEKHFTSLINASFAAVESKAQEEVEHAALEAIPPGEAAANDHEPLTEPDDTPLTRQALSRPSEGVLMKRSKLAAEMAISKVEFDRKLQFIRNVTPANRPGLVFDAVAIGPAEATVVEVKYTVRAAYPTVAIRQILDRANKLQTDLLNDGDTKRFVQLILIFVTGDEVSDSERRGLVGKAEKLAIMYPFRVEVFAYRYGELIGAFA